MISSRLLPLSVTWQQPGETTDEYNNLVSDWAHPNETEIAAYIEQTTSTENVAGRDTPVTRLLFMTNELGVKSTHRIVWGADTFEIDGDCAVYQTPGGPHHLEATLLLVDGYAEETGS